MVCPAPVSLQSLVVSVAVGVVSAAPGAPFKDDQPSDLDDRFALTTRARMPVRLVERPLTLTRHTYGLIFDLDVSQVQPGVPLASFQGGAGYGISDAAVRDRAFIHFS